MLMGMFKMMLFTGPLMLLALGVAMGQAPDGPHPRGPMGPPPMHGPGGPGFAGIDGRTVTGSPFSAQIISTSSQTLSDGSHISRNVNTRVARDGQGRTYRQQSGDGAEKSMVFVHDPVAHTSHVISGDSKTAMLSRIPERDHGPRRAEGPPPEMRPRARNGETIETLAPQNIEGVWAEGTRITRTIPQGSIGNDRDLKVVSETWYSKELQMVVLSKHSDPRMGESSVRMTGLQRGEPDAGLFQVPAGYKVVERGHGR